MSEPRATLYFMCGKMAAGKSTLSKELARMHSAVLLNQDDWLAALYPGEILTIADYVRCSGRLRDALTPLVVDLLTRGTSVVLDHPGNTHKQRQWFRELFERANVPHELHFIDATDATCKRQLKQRSAALPEGSAWTTDAEFDAITAYFQVPLRTKRGLHAQTSNLRGLSCSGDLRLYSSTGQRRERCQSYQRH